jgi:imidazoleglycerol-phosphate dehydratase
LPMDDALSTVAFDFAGRYGFRFDAGFKREKIGDLSSELVGHFWDAFAQNAKANLFVKSEYGRNDHHVAEGIFKATAKAIRMACEFDGRLGGQLPSTKGRL